MQIAAFLSDLKSLSVCPPQAATDLVSVYKTIGQSKEHEEAENTNEEVAGKKDENLQRAEELVLLHQNVKVKQVESGPDVKLRKARQDVTRILDSLNQKA